VPKPPDSLRVGKTKTSTPDRYDVHVTPHNGHVAGSSPNWVGRGWHGNRCAVVTGNAEGVHKLRGGNIFEFAKVGGRSGTGVPDGIVSLKSMSGTGVPDLLH